ncbi:carboxypeptidase-like regulatory domain-containing protein [Antarcticibacterium flavum]|uniref:Carboxypeptidase-like regulatory domain-containing protein n=1 Tax=Antarcticibacterium flavum TaxID=2058175 RepID=A0A5B7X0C8_9FLAO|nr:MULTISPECIES: DUF5686 and carboxypeptidase-like regulatory domain-containing protein [Antarcticibacterium]MCM4161642.1 hypothetical protein [Antarcticibacterium sp. W02-3]QCY68956.1 carboxypeptidase-like regulatory domain-containing protein [Antarcticibacterium flavum]
MKQLFIFSFFLFHLFTAAQTRVSGVVKNEAGEPVGSANVVFLKSSEGTTTTEEGQFYLISTGNHRQLEVSFVGYETQVLELQPGNNQGLEILLKEDEENLDEVFIYRGKTSKKNNPAIDILRKIWENRRKNGVKAFDHYAFRKYEKLEFDINTVDSALMNSKVFKGLEFIFEDLDTNHISGKTYLPIFLNESIMQVHGNNTSGKKKEELLGNKNSGFNNNQILIAALKDLYFEVDVYDNYMRIFDKNFISPLSTTGIDTYNYVLADSSFIEDKWCYKVVYYPRRENELTFKGDFWVNDTAWAIKTINLEMAEKANINWVNGIYLEQEFEVYNDSVFLLKRDFLMADFSFEKKEDARGIYGKKTVVYDDFVFNEPQPDKFYSNKVISYRDEVYDREEQFWEENRLEPLNRNESGVYEMIDTLQTVKAFQRAYRLAHVAATGYVEFKGWDLGPVYNFAGYNEVEGFRLRAGARTFFGPNDPWRIEGYGAYGFRDQKFKYGILGQVMLDKPSRLIISAGYRRDIEQLGASLTNVTDVLGRSLASNSLLTVGTNDKLSAIQLATFGVEIEPIRNVTFQVIGSHRNLTTASPTFSLAWYEDEARTIVSEEINQAEVSTVLRLTPGRKTAGFGVDRVAVNPENFATVFLNYSVGVKDIFNSDFNYRKIQAFYDQPWWIGGLGLANVSLEAGKTFGEVPLGLLSVVPGNQTFFSMYNTFPLLNFYEFVTDTYISSHFEHNFNGRIFAYIPLLRDLNLREVVGIRGVWGEISEANRKLDASGMLLVAPSREPYWEYSVGVGNMFKFLRLDAHFRGNYFDNPDARSFGVTATFGFHF